MARLTKTSVLTQALVDGQQGIYVPSMIMSITSSYLKDQGDLHSLFQNKLLNIMNVQVQDCLSGKSGLRIPSQAHMARSSDLPASISARCKLDSILCGLFGSSSRVSCSSRLDKCRALISETPNCECAELELTDGRIGDCRNPDPETNRAFCFVKSSPCVVRDRSGFVVETSVPVSGTNGLLHLSYEACKFKNYF